MEEQNVYYLISFIDIEADHWVYWSLMRTKEEAERMAEQLLDGEYKDRDVFNYSVNPITVGGGYEG